MYDELATQLELIYYDDKNPMPKAEKLVVNEPYCTLADATVYRVRYLGMKGLSYILIMFFFKQTAKNDLLL